jgi:hypothetical protein
MVGNVLKNTHKPVSKTCKAGRNKKNFLRRGKQGAKNRFPYEATGFQRICNRNQNEAQIRSGGGRSKQGNHKEHQKGKKPSIT